MTTPPASEAAGPRRLAVLGRDPFWILVGVLVLANLVPLLVVVDPPHQDYPMHLVRARIFRDYGAPVPGYFAHYLRSWLPVPYALADWLTVALSLAVPLRVAGKVVLALTVTLVPLAVVYLLGGVSRERRLFGLAAFPAAYHWPLQMGFVTYSLSLAPAFASFGWWLRRRRDLRWRDAGVLAALLFLTYLGHLFTFGIVALALGFAALVDSRRRRLLPRVAASFVPTAAAALLARALDPSPRAAGTRFVLLLYDRLSEKLAAAKEVFLAFDPRDEARIFLVLALVLAPFVLAGVVRRETRPVVPLAFAVALVGLALPDHLGSPDAILAYVAVRAPLVLAALLLAFALPPRARWARGALAVFLATISLVRVAQLTRSYAAYDRGLEPFREVLAQLPESARPKLQIDRNTGRGLRVWATALYGNYFFLRSTAPRVPGLESFVGPLRPIAYRRPEPPEPTHGVPASFESHQVTHARALLVVGDTQPASVERAAKVAGFALRRRFGSLRWFERRRNRSNVARPSGPYYVKGFDEDYDSVVVWGRLPRLEKSDGTRLVEVFSAGNAHLLRPVRPADGEPAVREEAATPRP